MDFKRSNYHLSFHCPTNHELQIKVKRKHNGACPGLNRWSYVPYKNCTAIIKFVLKLTQKIWKFKCIPIDWAEAYIIFFSNLKICPPSLSLDRLQSRPLDAKASHRQLVINWLDLANTYGSYQCTCMVA